MDPDEIEFVGLLVRTTDGKTMAIDLEGKHVRLVVQCEVPYEDLDTVTEFGSESLWQGAPDRIDIDVSGRRKPEGTKLFTYRTVKDGEYPFPPFEVSESG